MLHLADGATDYLHTQLFAHAQKRGLQLDAIRFLMDDRRIAGDDTPTTLELEEGDQIDCVLEQQGGY
jgi:small ubiquitin-related modifier